MADELRGHHLTGDARCWLHGGARASPVQVPGWAVLPALVSEPVFNVEPGQAAGCLSVWHRPVIAPGNLSSSASREDRNLLGVCWSFSQQCEKGKASFPMGVTF